MPNISLETLLLDEIPGSESDLFEYKSSSISTKSLKAEISRAASAFCNSGGGCFIAGIGSDGKPDGGLEPTVGRQNLRDWVDQAIAAVSPKVRYNVRIYNTASVGHLEDGKVIVAISFLESHTAPHMSDDNKYYIRAGAHSVPAVAFIVESLWSRRSLSRPMLTHVIREKPGSQDVIQLGVIALNTAPAVDIEIDINPLTGLLRGKDQCFPMRLSVVDQNMPFFFDCSTFSRFEQDIHDSVVIQIRYHDISGNPYEHRSTRPLKEALGPIKLITDFSGKMSNKLDHQNG